MKKVLVADDTKNIRTLVGKCLSLEGYKVTEAVDGPQALEYLKTGDFSLAFLDIKMPGMSGTEVLRELRTLGIATKVIIITAYATVKNAVECTQMGASAYLHKPFTADKLRSVLAEIDSGESRESITRLVNEGRAREALAALKKELAENPLDPGIYRLLASVSEKLGLTEDSDKYIKLSQSLSD